MNRVLPRGSPWTVLQSDVATNHSSIREYRYIHFHPQVAKRQPFHFDTIGGPISLVLNNFVDSVGCMYNAFISLTDGYPVAWGDNCLEIATRLCSLADETTDVSEESVSLVLKDMQNAIDKANREWD